MSEPAPRRAVIPRATYRLQFNATFTLRDALALVPYLDELGISHVYCSPLFRARRGSLHGYDVVSHDTLNPEIGDRDDFERLVGALRARGMGVILDIVPNHVGVMSADNAWWMDVLENGPAAVHAAFFDIDWQAGDELTAGRLLVPVLGDQYGIVLEAGDIVPDFDCDAGSLGVRYHEHRFPLDPRTYPRVLQAALHVRCGGESAGDRAELESLAAAFSHLPACNETTSERIAERTRDKEILKRRLAELCGRSAAVREAIEAAVAALCGRPGEARDFDALDALLQEQPYRLAYWRVAADEINYRRFFDVNDLAALRMENPDVFAATHRLVLELVDHGLVDGLRIDHPDGLYDPAAYFRRLQQAAAGEGEPPSSPRELPLYVVVEKITARFERLPDDWPVHGTTGYAFANAVNGLLIDGATRARFDRLYETFIGRPLEWDEVAYQAKRLVLRTSLAAELHVLAAQLNRLARRNRRTRDFTPSVLRNALVQVIACFPVYRTYIAERASAEDRRYVDWAIGRAQALESPPDASALAFLRSVLLGTLEADDASLREDARAFTGKFQQVTAPVTAKGVEDTAFYRFNRLVSLNEVGGEPGNFGVSVRAFHADNVARAQRWPHELLATSTHDSKRSEDVRARLDVLSEMAADWRTTIGRWSRLNRHRRREVGGAPAPSPNDEYLLYQTLVATWPLAPSESDSDATASGGGTAGPAAAHAAGATDEYRERIQAYMLKAIREAKTRTSWTAPDAAYESAVQLFVAALLERREGNVFVDELDALVRRIGRFGLLNGLAQVACKLASPGVPDFYQGTEIWDFSLVDPDNRRPVDFAARGAALAAIREATRSAADLPAFLRSTIEHLEDGRAKLYLTWRALSLRRERPALFSHGRYVPLRCTGARAANVCAFAREHDDGRLVVIVPRLWRRLTADRPGSLPPAAAPWEDTRVELPAGWRDTPWRGVLDEQALDARADDGRCTLAVADALRLFPVALLCPATSPTETSR